MNGFVPCLLAALLAQWIPQNSGTVSGLRGVSAVNNKEAWASGQKGVFIWTANGGADWRSGGAPGAEALC